MNDNQFENCFRYLSKKCKHSIIRVYKRIYCINASLLFSTTEDMRVYFGYSFYDLRINNIQFKVDFENKKIESSSYERSLHRYYKKFDDIDKTILKDIPWENLKIFKSIILEHVYKNMKNNVIENLTKIAIKEMIGS